MSWAPSRARRLPFCSDAADRIGPLLLGAGHTATGRAGLDLRRKQAQAVVLVRAGHSVAVTGRTPGTPQFYEIPVAEAADALGGVVPPATSLLVFASKAAGRRQLRSMEAKGFPGVRPGAYDADSGRVERARMRHHATVVFTNPEMLHVGLLPHHGRWAAFLSRLRYIVIDELHAFRGAFGGHMAHIVRRLHRLAHYYGATPRFICCSAAMGAPAPLARVLCGVPFVAVRSRRTCDGGVVDGGLGDADLDRGREEAGCSLPDPDDPCALDAQLRCAAHELPLSHADGRYWPDSVDDAVRRLVLADQVVIRRRRSWLGVEAFYAAGGWPARDIAALR